MEPKKSKVPILNKPKTMKLIIILIIIIVVIGGVTMKKRRGVKIVFRLNKKQYTLGEPVYIHFIIHNHSKKGVDFDLGFDAKGNFKFIVRDIEGRLIKDIDQTPERGGLCRIGEILLKPKRTYSEKLLFNEWFLFTKQGKYRVSCELKSELKLVDGTLIEGEKLKKELTIEIKPRDKEQLRKIMTSLLDTINKGKGVGIRGEAALALSYINDESVVPFLVKVLDSKYSYAQEKVIFGFRRIGNIEATEALINALSHPDEATRVAAKSELLNLYNESQDPDVIALIKDTLKLTVPPKKGSLIIDID